MRQIGGRPAREHVEPAPDIKRYQPVDGDESSSAERKAATGAKPGA
ncbi:hypothetical protein QWZ10_02525 [Paracoccus cavernae]|uniref:Uncharacterized protein n=1 Tax=Paracoccus cavernae TaxID=1571207 RepID=A0ABT8D2F4_9RHOB|nr:hypothetical protein [Paracoccus cavernae]